MSIVEQIKKGVRFFKKYLRDHRWMMIYREINDMRINIVYPENEEGWIIGKFAKKVYSELEKQGINVTLSSEYKSEADINHYFTPNLVGDSKETRVDKHTSFMITHVDSMKKLDRIKSLTDKGALGICMSLDTRNKLISSGIRRNRICYINPAQDSEIRPRKIKLGFTHRLYSDNRKKNDLILEVCRSISPDFFSFIIMGSGWDSIIYEMRSLGFEVDYYPDFDKEKYNALMPKLDYYCYFGFDEGSMGFLDAVAAGVGTIVTPQGYHLDTNCGITYPVTNLNEIVAVLLSIQHDKEKHIAFLNEWTWENYTKKHVELWKYLLGCAPMSELMQNQGKYTDGIFSLMLDDLAYSKGLVQAVRDKMTGKGGDKR